MVIAIFIVYNLLDSHNAVFIYIFPKVERSDQHAHCESVFVKTASLLKP